MLTTVIFAHPWHGSFNKAVLDSAVKALQDRGKLYMVVDLYEEGFDPVLAAGDLMTYNEGKTEDYHVHDYIDLLKQTDEIAFIFPVWWYDAPAILKGFFDKVLLKNFAFTDGKNGLEPLLSMKKVLVITTSDSPTEVLVEEFGDPIRRVIIDGTLRVVGLAGGTWHNLGNISGAGDEEREEFLDEVYTLLST